MSYDKVVLMGKRASEESRSALDELARLGAQEMLMMALQNEVADYMERHSLDVDKSGKRQVVRNGCMPSRRIASGVGPLEIRQPRVNDRREGEKFTSKILTRFARRVSSVDNAIPILYLRGISTGDMSDALEALLGKNAAGLSATNIVRLMQQWEKDYQEWQKRSLEGKSTCIYRLMASISTFV